MPGLLDGMLPSLPQLAGLCAVLAAVLSLGAIGAVTAGFRRLPEADLFAGWGVAALLFTVLGTTTGLEFSLLSVLLLVAGGAAAIWLRGHLVALLPAGAGRLAMLALPLAAMVAAMQPSQWDEFSQWLHSTRYLYEVEGFPHRGNAEFPGTFASYPFGNAFPALLASVLARRFVENAGALVNVMALAAFALLLRRVIADGFERSQAAAGWRVSAAAWVAATIASPTFVPKVAFTAYADTATSIALATLGVLGWKLLAAIAERERFEARALALQGGLVGAALLSLKQANLVLFGLLVAGLVLIALRDREIRLSACGVPLVLLLAPGAVVYLAWRWHVGREFPGAEFMVRPAAQWATDLLPAILARMGSVAANKGGYFGLLLVMAALGLRGLALMRSPFDRLAVLAATVGVGYNAFLLFAYVTAFDRNEALTAASYWRYNMHVGPLVWTATVFGLAGLWSAMPLRPPRPVGLALAAVVALMPLGLAKYVRFDLRAPKQHVRTVAADLLTLLPQGARLAAVDPLDPGFYNLQMKYLLHPRTDAVLRVHIGSPPALDTAALTATIDGFGATHAWVHTQDGAVRAYFGQPLPDGGSTLLARGANGWAVVRRWPYPGYATPAAVRD